jgi:hypothetical protein
MSGGKFCRRQGLEHIELVTVWVGHDHPSDFALADVHAPGAQRFEPGDLRGLVGGAKVQIEPVLDGLSFRNFDPSSAVGGHTRAHRMASSLLRRVTKVQKAGRLWAHDL